MKLKLPVVRVRRLPAPDASLDYVEGPDWIGAVVALIVGLGFTRLGAAGAWQSPTNNLGHRVRLIMRYIA